MVVVHKYSIQGKLDQKFSIALGSNQNSLFGSPFVTLQKTLHYLTQLGTKVVSASPFYKTSAFPPDSGPDFVNSAALLQGNVSPEEILAILHQIEERAGRVRTKRWGPRVLDLDLIFYGNQVLPNQTIFDKWHQLPLEDQTTQAPNELILPHPRLQDRAFVLVPLADIAPDWVHPVLKKTVTEMRDALPPEALREVEPL